MALLRHQAPSWLLHLPALVPTELDALQQRSSGTTRERMLRELAETVETLSADRPLVLVLEDLHWSDGATLEWLAYVAQRRAAARLLVLGTYRPVEAAVRAHPVRTVVQELQMHNDAQELALGYLQESAIVSYLTQRFGRAALPEGFARFLHQRTTGNPLFLVTIVDALVQQGVLRHGVAGWELSGGVETAATGVPESLRQLIERQLEQLAPEDQVLLEVASVAGQEFAVAAVAAGLERAVDEVEARCAVLARRGQFVRVCGTDEWADGMVATRAMAFSMTCTGRPSTTASQPDGGCGGIGRSGHAWRRGMACGRGRWPPSWPCILCRGERQKAEYYLRLAGENALRLSAVKRRSPTCSRGSPCSRRCRRPRSGPSTNSACGWPSDRH